MAKKGNGLAYTARLDVKEAIANAKLLKKELSSMGIDVSKGFDTKPMSAFQQGIFALKKELQEKDKIWKDSIAQEKAARAQSAESKAAVEALKISEQELTNQLKAGKVTAEEYALAQKKIVDAQKLASVQQKEADRQAGEANKRLKEQLQLAKQQEAQLERNRKRLERESSEYYKLNQALNAVRGKAKDVLAEMFKLELQGKKNTQEYKDLSKSSEGLVKQTQILDKGIKNIDATLGLHQRHVGDYVRAIEGLNPHFSSINSQLAIFGTSIEQLAAKGGMAQFGASIVDVGKAMFEFLISPTGIIITALSALFGLFQANKGTVIDFDDRLLNVGKTTNLAGRNLLDLGNEVITLSRKLKTVSSSTLLDFATVAGQLGVKGVDNILAFSEALAKLEIATNIQGEEGGAEIARLLTLTDGGVQNVKAFGDEIVNLGNNFAATEKEILSNAEQISQNTGLYKIGRQEVLAYAVATKAVGLEAEVVGSAFNRTLSTFEKAIRTGKNIDELAKRTGLSVEQLKVKFKENSSEVFNDFIKGLHDVNENGGSVNEVLENLGIVAVRDQRVIATLATSGYDVLNRAITTVKDSSGALTTEFDTASGKLKNQTAKFGIAWDNLVLSIENGQGIIGKSASGVVNAFTDIVDGLTPSTRQFTINEEAAKKLTDRYDELKFKGQLLGGAFNLTRDDQEELRKVTAQIGELIPSVITQFDKYGNALDINRGKIDSMTKAQRELLAVQNKSDIKKANEQFNSAEVLRQKYQNDALKGTGWFTSDSDVVAMKDNAVKMSGYAYKAAKDIQNLGGTLTKAQKDVIDYYEKTKEVIVKNGTAIKNSTESNTKGTARTADVIKAEIAAITELQKPLDVASSAYAENVKKIKALKKELAQANGTYKEPGIKGNSEINAQRTLQSEIDALTKKGRNKQLDADAQELADVDAKYKKLREKAIAFNNDPKNKLKGLRVDSGGLLQAQSSEEDALRDKQAAVKLKTTIDAQKKVYEDFEQFKTQIGEAGAAQRFAKELGSAKTYLEYLRRQEAALLPDDKAKGGDGGGQVNDLQLKEVRDRIKEVVALNKKKDDDIFAYAYQAAETYNQRLTAIEVDYNLKRKALAENATSDQLAQLQLEKDERIRSANLTNSQQQAGYAKLMMNYDAMTRGAIVKRLEAIREGYKKEYREGKLTAEQLKQLVDGINGQLGNLNGNNTFKSIVSSIKNYRDALKSLPADSVGVKEAQSDMFGSIANGASDASAVIGDVANSLSELGIGGEGLQDALKGVQGIMDGAGSIAKGIASGNPVDIVTGSIKLLTSAIQLFNVKDKKLEKQIQGYKDQLDSLGNAYKQLERDVQNSVGESIYSDQAAQIENLKNQQIALTKARDAERSKKKADQGKIDEFQNQIDAIPGQIEDIQKAIGQSLIQTTFKDLANALSDAFVEAFSAGEDAAGRFDVVFKKVIANAISNSLKLKILDPVVKKFTDDLTAYASANGNSVIGFDFDAYKKQLKDAGDLFTAGLKGSEEFFKDVANAASGATPTAVTGVITSAGLTEDSANKAMGTWRGTFDNTKLINLNVMAGNKIKSDIYAIATQNLSLQVKIEANTLRTANNTDNLEAILKKIDNNTSSGSSYQSLLNGGVKP